MAQTAHERSLPAGTVLHGAKYTIGRVLGESGFGITYQGTHKALQRLVAIKELFPEDAVRWGTRRYPQADKRISAANGRAFYGKPDW